VGGDREQRSNWIFAVGKEITCVIFLAAIDEFDTYVLTEDSKVRRGQQGEKFMSGSLQEQKNKLVESIEVFKEIQNIEYLSHATFILFLNKVDVFREKIQTSNLIDHFDDFPEGFEKDENFALKFLKDRFINANLDRSGKPIRQIYSHQTTATDTEAMRFVFEVVKDTILQLNLKQYNLV